MAKRRTKVLQARKSDASRDDDSLLIQSAESLGRVIGSLQRQVQGGGQRVSTMAEDALDALPADVIARGRDLIARGTRARKTGGAKSGARNTSASRKSSGARKSPGARKNAASRKRAGSQKAGGTRKASAGRKTTRTRKTARARKSSRNKV